MKKQTHLHLGLPESEYIFIILINYSFNIINSFYTITKKITVKI